MISPHTTPGTRVICINDHDCEGTIYEGEIYTVRQIVRGRDCNRNAPTFGQMTVSAELEEVPPARHCDGVFICGFELRRFRLAVLPKALTDLLKTEETVE